MLSSIHQSINHFIHSVFLDNEVVDDKLLALGGVLTHIVCEQFFDIIILTEVHLVETDTVSGKVHIEGACDTWDVNSVSGNVELICTDVPARKIGIGTVSASATVALPGNIRGFVAKFSGMSGKLINEFGPDRYGTCALPVQMDSMSGSLRITRL
jgi:hypothetical protein